MTWKAGGKGIAKVVALGWALVFGSSRAWAFDYPLPGDPWYRRLAEELEIRGLTPLLKGYGPYSYQETAIFMDDLPDETWVDYHELGLKAFNPVYDAALYVTPALEIATEKEAGEPCLATWARGGVVAGHDDWSMAGTYQMRAGRRGGESGGSKSWRGLSGRSDQVYIRYSGQRSHLQIGKDRLWMGMGLVMSGEKSFERIQAEYRFNRNIKLFFFTGQLDKTSDSAVVYNRFLAGHRAEITLGSLQLGLSEMAIYGGQGRFIESYYFLPLYVFQAEQLNQPLTDDNIIWDMDIKVVKPPFRFKAELMVDDFQIDRETESDREPTEAGFAVQADWAWMDRPLMITTGAKYLMVTDWTFNQPRSWNRFMLDGLPLGIEYGNDYQIISLETGMLGKGGRGGLEIYLLRKGEGTIEAAWTEPWINDPSWKPKFPSGTIESRWGAKTEMSYCLRKMAADGRGGGCFVNFGVDWSRVKNRGHLSGQSGTDWNIRLGIEGLFYSDLFTID